MKHSDRICENVRCSKKATFLCTKEVYKLNAYFCSDHTPSDLSVFKHRVGYLDELEELNERGENFEQEMNRLLREDLIKRLELLKK